MALTVLTSPGARIDWEISPTVWREFVQRCPNATFFHTPGWYQSQADVHGYGLATARLSFADGKEALLPLATRPIFKGALQEAVSGIEAAYGGLVSPEPLSPEQVDAAYRLVRERFGDLTVIGNPHEAYPNTPVAGLHTEDFTQAVPLAAPEDLFKLMTKERARQIRKAAKEGFRFEALERPTEADVARFLPVYQEHSASWQYDRWVKDEAYFKALLRHAGDDARLFMVWDGDTLAAFRLIFARSHTGMALHLARAKAYEKTGAGFFLAGESMAWCHDHGLKTLDLMPSGVLDSVRAYKASVGGQALPYRVVSHSSWLGASLRKLWRLAKAA